MVALSFMSMSCRRPSLPSSGLSFLRTGYTRDDDDDENLYEKLHANPKAETNYLDLHVLQVMEVL